MNHSSNCEVISVHKTHDTMERSSITKNFYLDKLFCKAV